MDKHAIRIEINNLLDTHCKDCKLIAGQDTLPICKTCQHYKILRQLGDQLLKPEGKTLAALTVEKYIGFIKQGLSAADIAERYGVTKTTVYSWKSSHKAEIEKAQNAQKSSENEQKTDEKAPESNEIEKSPNQDVVGKISTKCKQQEKEIAQLKNDNNDLQQQLTYAQRAQDAAEKKATELQAQYSAATAFIVTLLAR